jgi:hypothetical protein
LKKEYPGDLEIELIMQKPYFGTKKFDEAKILHHSCERKPN